MADRQTSPKISIFKELREEVTEAKKINNWRKPTRRAWLHLQRARTSFFALDGQSMWEEIQRCAKKKPWHFWLFVEAEVQHYVNLVPPQNLKDFKAAVVPLGAEGGARKRARVLLGLMEVNVACLRRQIEEGPQAHVESRVLVRDENVEGFVLCPTPAPVVIRLAESEM